MGDFKGLVEVMGFQISPGLEIRMIGQKSQNLDIQYVRNGDSDSITVFNSVCNVSI